MATFVNLTPHGLTLNDGTILPASGQVARVSASFTEFDQNGICHQKFGDVENLPESKEDTIYVVSALVLATVKDREDVVAPATGHPDCVRNNGMIVSVPGFVR